jgi:hypothetical protein
MSRRPTGGSSQPELFARSKCPAIALPDNHPMVVLTDTLDWGAMEARVQQIRARKLKSAAGRPPHLRATIGALVLMALRRLPYRETEEQIRYYAPARYLCGLTETSWTPDFTTVQDFAELLGEEGVRLINEAVVTQAVGLGLADPKVAVADMTAQEAAIPHPNEMGHLGAFVRTVEVVAKTAGGHMKEFVAKAKDKLAAAKQQLRKYRLFAGEASKAAKNKLLTQMANIVEGINGQLGQGAGCRRFAMPAAPGPRGGRAAQAGRARGDDDQAAAADPLLAADWVRGREQDRQPAHPRAVFDRARQGGQDGGVRTGLGHHPAWGRVRAGNDGGEQEGLHGHELRRAGRGAGASVVRQSPAVVRIRSRGWSEKNVERLRALGVRDVGLAPRGRAAWQVEGKVRQRLIRERAKVEGSIGTIKGPKYGFNRPAARSAAMMGVCGQRAALGLNLTKLARGAAGKRGITLAA